MIRGKMIFINVSSEAILTNTFASVELKDVRDLPVKLNLVTYLLIKCGIVFI